jgi:2,3-bisphosphoglycerate-dependent phosphoglycerate mutase
VAKLILLRHFKSQWNKENRFTGWTDVPLSEEGRKSAGKTAEKLSGMTIDIVYTSPLVRNRESVSLAIGKKNAPIVIDKALDERNYGKLQGMNKDEAAKVYGKELVHLWRRSWDQTPPGGESLKDVYARTTAFFQKYIEKDLRGGKNVLVVASHNSLRAIVKYLEKISDQDIINLEIPFGGLLEYEFNGNFYKRAV